mgnify:FL=1
MSFREISFYIIFLFAGISLFGQNDHPRLISPPLDNIFDFYVSPTHNIYFGNKQNLWIHNIFEDTMVAKINIDLTEEITVIVASEARKEIFLGTKNGSIVVVDFQNNNITHLVNHKNDRITSLTFDAQQNNLLAGGIKGTVYSHRVADINHYETLHTCPGQITNIDLSSENNYLAVSDGSGTLTLFDAENLNLISSSKLSKHSIRDFKFIPDSKRFVAVDEEGRFTDWRIREEKYFVNLRASNESSNWLLAVDIGANGTSFCFGEIGRAHV